MDDSMRRANRACDILHISRGDNGFRRTGIILVKFGFCSGVYNGMGMDPFVVFPAEWAAAGFEIHPTSPTLPFPSGYTLVVA